MMVMMMKRWLMLLMVDGRVMRTAAAWTRTHRRLCAVAAHTTESEITRHCGSPPYQHRRVCGTDDGMEWSTHGIDAYYCSWLLHTLVCMFIYFYYCPLTS